VWSLLLEFVLAGVYVVHGDVPKAKDFGGWPEEPAGEGKSSPSRPTGHR
jgi:hypothetical protein